MSMMQTSTLLPDVACFLTGIVIGAWLVMARAAAAMSRSQERMQRKVLAVQDDFYLYRTTSRQPDDQSRTWRDRREFW